MPAQMPAAHGTASVDVDIGRSVSRYGDTATGVDRIMSSLAPGEYDLSLFLWTDSSRWLEIATLHVVVR
jgi:hypothetical protein